jgi:hypothetical protein
MTYKSRPVGAAALSAPFKARFYAIFLHFRPVLRPLREAVFPYFIESYGCFRRFFGFTSICSVFSLKGVMMRTDFVVCASTNVDLHQQIEPEMQKK